MMKTNKFLDEIRATIPQETQQMVAWSVEIANTIYDFLEKNKLTQKDFAKRLGKNEAEVSRYLQGTHNFTLATLAKISAVIGADILKKTFSSQPIYINYVLGTYPSHYIPLKEEKYNKLWQQKNQLQCSINY